MPELKKIALCPSAPSATATTAHPDSDDGDRAAGEAAIEITRRYASRAAEGDDADARARAYAWLKLADDDRADFVMLLVRASESRFLVERWNMRGAPAVIMTFNGALVDAGPFLLEHRKREEPVKV